ncbi:hypothetical protein, partial [Methylicorpusculum sp.]|uniref:hypothetical protein n=1 Tax=Methylicorpusculum sp. TaxID=2713644 RepID=UPI002ABB41ED
FNQEHFCCVYANEVEKVIETIKLDLFILNLDIGSHALNFVVLFHIGNILIHNEVGSTFLMDCWRIFTKRDQFHDS